MIVVSLADSNEKGAAEEFRGLFPDLHVYNRPPGRTLYRLIQGLGSSLPGTSAKYWYPDAGNLIREVIAERKPKVVEFHTLNMAAYRRYAGGLPTVFREHNAQYKIWERHAETAHGWVERAYVRWCAPRVRRFEAESAARFDRCVTVSKADAAHLQAVAPEARIEVIPSGVDTEYFNSAPEIPEEPFRMVLTGSFDWKPKQHNLRVLLAEIMPQIRAKSPEAKLDVVGKVPDELKSLGEQTPGVTMTGPVPDVRPYVRRASLVLNYLETGGGIALKLLEAMAMRKTILSNSLGCEGIDVEHGKQVFLADGPEKYAEAAARLLGDAGLRLALAERGHQLVLKSYSWKVIADQFQHLYETLISEHSGTKRPADLAKEQAEGHKGEQLRGRSRSWHDPAKEMANQRGT